MPTFSEATFFERCVPPLILLGETHKKVFADFSSVGKKSAETSDNFIESLFAFIASRSISEEREDLTHKSAPIDFHLAVLDKTPRNGAHQALCRRLVVVRARMTACVAVWFCFGFILPFLLLGVE
jgi:hypothetical protein